MNLKDVFAAVNQMQSDGIIERYAVGGAVGATFHIEPVATIDVDIFLAVKPAANQIIVSLQPIYEYLTARGAAVEGEYLVIAGWPVQFLPPTGPLVEEAIAEAVRTEVEGEPVWVFAAEHLAAIALQTGRGKDKARLVQFVEAGVLDAEKLNDILVRHGLVDRWRRFEEQFLGDVS